MSMQRRSRLPPLAYIYICEHIYIYIYRFFLFTDVLTCGHGEYGHGAVTASAVTARSLCGHGVQSCAVTV